jgi:hypothetical protein
MPTLSHQSKSEKRAAPQAPKIQQLSLLSSRAKAQRTALYAKPAEVSHHGRSSYFFQIYCSFNHRQFGGLYSKTEADLILAEFQGHPWQIEPRLFGAAAERAIQQGRAGQ